MTEHLQTPSRRWAFWETPGRAGRWPSHQRGGKKSTAEMQDGGGYSQKERGGAFMSLRGLRWSAPVC